MHNSDSRHLQLRLITVLKKGGGGKRPTEAFEYSLHAIQILPEQRFRVIL